MTLGQHNYICRAKVCPAVTYCHVTELGRRFPNVGIDGCKHVDTNGWYTLVGQPVANKQKDVGPTLAANVGQTQLRTLGRSATNGCMLSEVGLLQNVCKISKMYDGNRTYNINSNDG